MDRARTARLADRVERVVRDLDLPGRLADPATALDPVRNPWVSIYPPFDAELPGGSPDPTAMLREWTARPRAHIAFLYLRFPFCPRRCDFCYFDVTTDLAAADAYVRRLAAEAAPFLDHVTGPARVDHLYLGGGTPSALRTDLLGRLLQDVLSRRSAETLPRTTIELHPRYVHPDFEELPRQGLVNRVSVGVQTTNPTVLERLGRQPATAEDVRALCARVRATGVEEVNVDLMVGLHGQTLADTLRDLDLVDDLLTHNLVDSVTVYPRSYTRESRLPAYERATATELLERMRMQLAYVEYFRDREDWWEYPSHFYSRRMAAPLHPSSTSRGRVAKPGLGNSAYSHFDATNYRNRFGVHDYVDAVDRYTGATADRHTLTADEAVRRALVFGAKSGVIPTGMAGSPAWHCAVDAWLDRQQAQGMLERHDTTARLTTLGILFVEALIRDLGQFLGDVPIT